MAAELAQAENLEPLWGENVGWPPRGAEKERWGSSAAEMKGWGVAVGQQVRGPHSAEGEERGAEYFGRGAVGAEAALTLAVLGEQLVAQRLLPQ